MVFHKKKFNSDSGYRERYFGPDKKKMKIFIQTVVNKSSLLQK